MTEDTCPICDEPIEAFESVDPVTFVLQPCGHQIDDRMRSDLSTAGEDASNGE